MKTQKESHWLIDNMESQVGFTLKNWNIKYSVLLRKKPNRPRLKKD